MMAKKKMMMGGGKAKKMMKGGGKTKKYMAGGGKTKGGKAGGKMSMAQVNAFLKSKGMKAVKVA